MSVISSWTEVPNEAMALAKRRKRTPEPSAHAVDPLHASALEEQESLEFDGPYGWGKTGRPPAATNVAGPVTEATKHRHTRKAAAESETIDDNLLDEASPYGWGRSGRPPVTAQAVEETIRPPEPARAKMPVKPAENFLRGHRKAYNPHRHPPGRRGDGRRISPPGHDPPSRRPAGRNLPLRSPSKPGPLRLPNRSRLRRRKTGHPRLRRGGRWWTSRLPGPPIGPAAPSASSAICPCRNSRWRPWTRPNTSIPRPCKTA